MTFDIFTRDDAYIPGRIVVHARTEGQPLSSGASYVFTPEGEFERGGRRVSLDEMNAIRAAAGFAPIARFQMEFRDYPADDLPALPAGFEDASWHNDACPSFRDDARDLTIWTDYADPQQREWPDAPRFVLQHGDSDVIASDIWENIVAALKGLA